MVARTRTRSSSQVGGAAWHPSDPTGTFTRIVYTPFVQETKDVWKKIKRPDGSLPPSFFESNTHTRRPSTISRTSTGSAWSFDRREIGEVYTANTDGYYPLPGSTARNNANQLYATQLLAATHPFAPVFSVPVAIKELAEVAGMFKLAANTFAGYVGGAYLNYRFGWKAFVRDVKTLSSITEAIEKRITDFNYLLEHGHTRKSKQLDHWTLSNFSNNVIMHSAYATAVYCRVTRNYSMKTWGSVTWGLTGDKLLEVDGLRMFNQAVRVVLDLEEIDPPTLWELIPFSWLVDYFVNIGDTLQSQHLRYKIQPYDVCIMRHFRNEAVSVVTDKPSSVSASGQGKYLREIKTRDHVFPSLTPTLNADLLSQDRWLVLLALLAKFRD